MALRPSVAGADAVRSNPPQSGRTTSHGQDHRVRRGGTARSRARDEPARRRRQGHPRPQGPQRRPREEVGRPHDHQRWCLHRQGDRARGPVREDRRRAGQGSRQEDGRRRRRRHDHRDRARPGARPRGPAQRRRRRQPDGPQARHREGRRGRLRCPARAGQGRGDQGADRFDRLHLRRRHPDRRDDRRGDGQGRQGRRHHRRGVADLRSRARAHRGHALRQGLHLGVLRHRHGAHGGVARRPVHPDRQLQDRQREGPPSAAREGHAVRQAAADHRRGRRGRGPVDPGRQQDPWHLQVRRRQGSGLR